jgi:hypothetical protein
VKLLPKLESDSAVFFFAGFTAAAEHLLPLLEEARVALGGCSDGNCILLGRRGGQHTNGGCRCKHNARQALTRISEAIGENGK